MRREQVRGVGAPLVVIFIVATLFTARPLSGGGIPQATPAGTPRLEDGTVVKIRLTKDISSATAQDNDRVDFVVLEDVKVAGLVVIPKGSVAWGTVTKAQAKRRVGRGGKLDVTIDSVRLADGDKAALRGLKDVKGGGHTGAMTGGIVATSLIAWPAAPLFLLMHGKDVTIPQGTELTVYVNSDFPIDPAKFGGASVAGPAAPPAGSAPPTIVLVDPSVTNSGDTIDVTAPSLTIRGVVTDPSGIPAVTINGSPVAMLPKGPQVAGFTSEAMTLQSGDNAFEVIATNAAHLQAKVSFVARYSPSTVISAHSGPRPANNALSKGDIVSLLQGGVPNARMVTLVTERGIAFTPSDDDIKQIRAAGGSENLVNTLKQAKSQH